MKNKLNDQDEQNWYANFFRINRLAMNSKNVISIKLLCWQNVSNALFAIDDNVDGKADGLTFLILF